MDKTREVDWSTLTVLGVEHHAPHVGLHRETLGLVTVQEGARGVGLEAGAPGSRIDGEEGLGADGAEFRRGDLDGLFAVQGAEKDEDGCRWGGRVELLDSAGVAHSKGAGAHQGLDAVQGEAGEAAEDQEVRGGAGGGGGEEGGVGAEEQVAIEGAAGVVVDRLRAEAPGEHGGFVAARGHGGGRGKGEMSCAGEVEVAACEAVMSRPRLRGYMRVYMRGGAELG